MAIAEIYESELADMEKAISSYQQAADYYKGEESNRFGANYHLAQRLKMSLQLCSFSFCYVTYIVVVMSFQSVNSKGWLCFYL